MPDSADPKLAEKGAALCHCLALRQASRHVSQLYDQRLAPHGLRTTQFSILAKLHQFGPLSVNALAEEMVLDRTTLTRTIQPLQRDGLVAVEPSRQDRRSKELHLTEAGRAKLREASVAWFAAQAEFEAAFGADRASALRMLLREISTADFGVSAEDEADA